MGPQVHAKFQTQSAQPLPRYSRRNICDIPLGSTRHVPQLALTWFGIVPIHGRRDGATHQRRRLVNRAYGSRDISLSKAWPRPAGRRAGGPLLLRFLVYISRNSLRASRSLVTKPKAQHLSRKMKQSHPSNGGFVNHHYLLFMLLSLCQVQREYPNESFVSFSI